MSSSVTMQFNGGEALKKRLWQMSQALGAAKSVRVGFLETSVYARGGYAEQLAAAVKRAQKEARTGWARLFSAWSKWGLAHGGGLHVAQVAFWLEFGTTRMKPRPFFRNTIRSKSPRWGYWLGRFLTQTDFNAQVSMRLLGTLITEQLQESIRTWPADNKPMTVFVKGFNHGLINFGTLQRNVDFEVK